MSIIDILFTFDFLPPTRTRSFCVGVTMMILTGETNTISFSLDQTFAMMLRFTSFVAILMIVSIDGCAAFVSPPALQSSIITDARPSSGVLDAAANNRDSTEATVTRRTLLSTASIGAFLLATPSTALARLEAVNRPDLLPSEKGLNVIQTEKFLTTGQAKRLNDLLTALERDTGYRVRVLCQAYPNTPGLVRSISLICCCCDDEV